jgi:CheY-like chemotaxis protein
MKVLLLEDVRSEREISARLLTAARHEVAVAADSKEAFEALRAHKVDVVVLDLGFAGGKGLEVLKSIRSQESTGHVYIIAQGGKSFATDIHAAFLAGADDFLRKPITREELLLRVEGPTRILKWAKPVSGTGGVVHDLDTAFDPTSMRTWREAATLLSTELGDMVGQAVAVDADQARPAWAIGAAIPLSFVQEQAEMRVTVGVDRASLAGAGDLFLGMPDAAPELIRDAVREIANTLAGAVKRNGLTDGIELTVGLPMDLSERPAAPEGGAAASWVMRIGDKDIRLLVDVTVVQQKNNRVPVAQLKEGMVLRQDLKNEFGALLIPAGTRLTATTAARISKLMGDRYVVEVANAA